MIKKILILGVTILCCGIASELYLRLAYVGEVSHSDYDETIGRIRRPGFKYIWHKEGYGIRQYNDYGYIGPNYPKERSPNTIRIALIGDSFIEGFQVFERNHFRAVFERALQEKNPDKKIEVLNFGRSAFNVCKMYCYHQDFIDGFDPDVVVYMLATEDYVEYSSDPALPECYYEADTLRLDYSFKTSAYIPRYMKFKFLTQNFSTLQLVRNSFSMLSKGKAPKILLDRSYRGNLQGLPFLTDETIEYYSNLTTALFENLDPKKTIFVQRGDYPMISDGTDPELPYKYSFKEILDFYEENGFHYYDLKDTIQALEELDIETRTWYSRYVRGHWNYDSHNAIGLYLARKTNAFLKEENIN